MKILLSFPAASRRRILFSPLAIFLVFVLWSLALTYPLVLQPASHIPLGDEKAGTVPFFNLWSLQWNIDQLMSGYPNYWDAPIFAPTKGTFAFSEPQPLSAILAAPLWLGLASPALAYNALVLLFLTLNGWFAYWLLRAWNLSPLPALLAGIFVQSLPFIAQEMGVLQLIAIFGFTWSLLYLHRFLAFHPAAAGMAVAYHSSLGLALALPVTFFTCGYYGLFALLFLPLALLGQLQPRHLNAKTLGHLAAISLLALALVGPFLWAQRERLVDLGLNRDIRSITANSARLEYYGNFLDYNLWWGRLLHLQPGQGQRLFPGFGLMLLAGLGVLAPQRPRVKLYLLLAIALALVLSLGLQLRLGEVEPYQWLREYVPGFAQLRSPFRFAVLVQLHLALLAGFGLQVVSAHRSVQVVVAALVIFEALALPVPLQSLPVPVRDAPWQTWLNSRSQPATIVRLPFAPGPAATDFEQTTRWMLEGRAVSGDMVNGYSGFFPEDHHLVREEMRRLPTHRGIALLRNKGVDYIVVDRIRIDSRQATALKRQFPLVFEDPVYNISIYALDNNQAE